MQEPRSWRELLRSLIERPEEKRNLSERSSIPQRTLERWASGQTKEPQRHVLHALLDAVPIHREQFIALLKKEFDDFDAPRLAVDETMPSIPVEFYARVVEAHATLAAPLHFWIVSSLILQQAASMMDSERAGMLITMAQCLPPMPGRPVRSLFERAQWGSYPWKQGLQQEGYFLGAESLAGHVAATCQSAIVQNIVEERPLFPVKPFAHELSAVAFPIQRAGRIAGSLTFSSTRLQFFTPAKVRLGQAYAQLLALAFEKEEMYNQAEIYLERMPSIVQQQSVLANFARQVLSLQEAQNISLGEAEQRVRQQMEDTLLAMAQEQETEQEDGADQSQ